MRHTLAPSRSTLHGSFRPDLAPALRVESGDIIEVTTLDVSWGLEQHPLEGSVREKFPRSDEPRDRGPALCGPIEVTGATPGQWLEVEFIAFEPLDWGWTWSGDNGFDTAFIEALGLPARRGELLRWTIDPKTSTGPRHCTSEAGQRVPLDPFFGTVGLPTAVDPSDDDDWQIGWFPRATGGNLDCPELTAGARLFLPVETPGALLSLGDAHAAQGDGELAGSAIECRLDPGTIRVTLHDDPLTPLGIPSPENLDRICLALNRAGQIVTYGVDRNLDAAIASAVRQAITILTARDDVSPYQALAHLSAAGHLRFSQIVNEVRGVHVILPQR